MADDPKGKAVKVVPADTLIPPPSRAPGGLPSSALGVPVAPSTPTMPTLAPPPMTADGSSSPQLPQAAAQATLAKQRPNFRPNAMGLIQDLISPPMQASGPNQMARPVSRLDTFEHFLGNFLDALGQGMANSGHGPGANIRGAGAALEAPYQRQAINTQLAAQQAQAAESQGRAALSQAQAQPVDIPGVGQVPAGNLGGYFGAQGRVQAQQIATQGRVGVAQMQLMAATGQVSKIVPVQEEDGTLHMRMLNKYGQPIGDVDGALPPVQYLNKQTTTGEWKEGGDGSYQFLPKTTTSSPQLPVPAGTVGGAAIPVGKGGVQAAGYRLIGGSAPEGQTPKRQGSGFYGKSSADLGAAYNPKANEWQEITRKDAFAQGLQNFQKYTGSQHEDNRQLNNRLYDVAQKITRYNQSLTQPISDSDRGAIAGVLSSDSFKIGAFGAEIPVDRLNQALDRENVKNLSPAAKNRLLSYLNARESLVGYQRVLAGSSKGSDTQLHLNLSALPSPVMPDDFTKEGIRQFTENIDNADQGLPRMAGIQTARDILHPKGGSSVDALIKKYATR